MILGNSPTEDTERENCKSLYCKGFKIDESITN